MSLLQRFRHRALCKPFFTPHEPQRLDFSGKEYLVINKGLFIPLCTVIYCKKCGKFIAHWSDCCLRGKFNPEYNTCSMEDYIKRQLPPEFIK